MTGSVFSSSFFRGASVVSIAALATFCKDPFLQQTGKSILLGMVCELANHVLPMATCRRCFHDATWKQGKVSSFPCAEVPLETIKGMSSFSYSAVALFSGIYAYFHPTAQMEKKGAVFWGGIFLVKQLVSCRRLLSFDQTPSANSTEKKANSKEKEAHRTHLLLNRGRKQFDRWFKCSIKVVFVALSVLALLLYYRRIGAFCSKNVKNAPLEGALSFSIPFSSRRVILQIR